MEKFSSHDREFIEKKLRKHIYPQLKDEPHYGNNIRNLVGYKPETWRYWIGRYRVFYTPEEDEKMIYVLSIDFRKDAY